MPFTYQTRGAEYTAPIRKKDIEQLAKVKSDYAAIANQQLANIASGDNWNPWLSLKRWSSAGIPLMISERRVDPADSGDSAMTNRRESAWDAMKQKAEEAYKTKKRYVPDFNY